MTPSTNELEAPRDALSAHKETPRANTPPERSASVSAMETSITVDGLEDAVMVESSPSPETVTPFAANTPAPETDGSPHTASAETSPAVRNARLTAVAAVSRETETPEILLPASTAIPKFLAIIPKKSKTNVYDYLSTSQDPHFRSLLQTYIRFENAAASLDKTGSLSTTKRPDQIPSWIRAARAGTTPSWSNLRDYGTSVIEWWSFLQPDWRVLECGKNMRKEGTLDGLCQPGINGLLNIVILAYWWSNGIRDSSTDSRSEEKRYHWFVNDVSWVLFELVKVVASEA